MFPFAYPSDSDTLRVLKRVSRAFYISIRVLPQEMRHPVGMAYSLARTADIISDVSISTPENRMKRLKVFHAAIRDRGTLTAVSDVPLIPEAAESLAEDERELLGEVDETLRKLELLSNVDGALTRSVVSIICEGMEFDIERFAPAKLGAPIGVSEEELDSYTYQVAGCVGEFWTDVLMAHSRSLGHWDRKEQARLGIAYGKGLQIVNILRDAPVDLRLGRCYIPNEWLAETGMRPRDLLYPANSQFARRALVRGVRLALEYFESAEAYMLSIPRRCVRLRLATAWPLLMGLGTLEEVALNRRWLAPEIRSKVSRNWVYAMAGKSAALSLSNDAMRRWVSNLRARVEAAIE